MPKLSRTDAGALETLHELVTHAQQLLLFDLLRLQLVLQACTVRG